jgi:hypothetical protein
LAYYGISYGHLSFKGKWTGMSRWQRERLLVLARCSRWVAEIERMLPVRGRVTLELDPGSEPAPETSWNWLISLEVGEIDFQALVAEDLTVAAFENQDGQFDDDVKLDNVPSYVSQRLS